MADHSQEQRQRERDAIGRAAYRTNAALGRAIAEGRQANTAHGRRLFRACSERVTAAIDRRLSAFVQNPSRAGYQAAGLPVLARLFDPARVTAVVLPVLLNRITQPMDWDATALLLGQALERELAVRDLRARVGPYWMRYLSRHCRGQLAKASNLERFGMANYRWTSGERRMVGELVLDLAAAASGLLQEVPVPGGGRQLRATDAARQIISACPPEPVAPTYGPMVCRPRPWARAWGGGLLETNEELIRAPSSRRGEPYREAMSHLEGCNLSTVLAAANHLQLVQLRIDAEMAGLQLESWRGEVKDLWKAGPSPVELPRRPARGEEEASRRWRAAYRMAKDREREERQQRQRITKCLAVAEQLAGRPIFQAVQMDHRGRCYTRNTLASHQGPDHQKALLQFGQGEPMGDEGARWLLIAAANHHGCGRLPWAEREAYGRRLIADMRAIASSPLDRLELWRATEDPWQFLQVAVAWSAWEHDRSAPVCCPVRLDQTTSGPGILAALLQDRRLAEACNMAGRDPADLYLTVLSRVQAELDRLAFQGSEQEQGHAVTLRPLVGREQMKVAVMTAPYGASYLSLVDSLTDWLVQQQGQGQGFRQRVLAPAQLLARVIHREAHAVTKAANTFRGWFNRLGAEVLANGQMVAWTTPSGLVVSTGERPQTAAMVRTETQGSWRVANIHSRETGAQVSANATRRKLVANLIHSLDASMVHLMASTAAEHGVPLLANHDCFATLPSRAGWLHQELLRKTQQIYGKNLLAQLVTEIAERGKLDGDRVPPVVGDLDPKEIGSNTYLYG